MTPSPLKQLILEAERLARGADKFDRASLRSIGADSKIPAPVLLTRRDK